MPWIEDEAAAELARQHDERMREAMREMVQNIKPEQGKRIVINGEPELDQAQQQTQDQQPDPEPQEPKMPPYSSEHGQPGQGLKGLVNQLRMNQRPDGGSRAVLK